MTVDKRFDSTTSQHYADDFPGSAPRQQMAKRVSPRAGWRHGAARQQTFAPALREPHLVDYEMFEEEPCPLVVEIPEVCAELCTVKEEDESDISDQTPVPEPEAEMIQSSRDYRSNDEADDEDGQAPLDETLLRLQRKVAVMLDAYGVGVGHAGGGNVPFGDRDFDAQDQFNEDIEYLELQRRLLQKRLRASEQRRRNLEQDNKDLQLQLQSALRGSPGGGSSPSKCRMERRREDNHRTGSSPRPRHPSRHATPTLKESPRYMGSPSPPKRRSEKTHEPSKVVRPVSRSALTSSGSLRPFLQKVESQEKLQLERRDAGRAHHESHHHASEVARLPRRAEGAERYEARPQAPLARRGEAGGRCEVRLQVPPHERVQAGNGRSPHCRPQRMRSLSVECEESCRFPVDSEAFENNFERVEASASSASVPQLAKSRLGPGRGLIWPALPKAQSADLDASITESKTRNTHGTSREGNGSRPRQRTGDVLAAARRHSRDSGRRQTSASQSPRRSAASQSPRRSTISPRLARSSSGRGISPDILLAPRPPSRSTSCRKSCSQTFPTSRQAPPCAFNPDSYMRCPMLS